MREIKFRAWDKEDSQICEVGAIDWDGYGKICTCNTLDKKLYMCDPDDFILMQFTGLKDKNGKEIYEGDIVQDGIFISKIEWLDKSCCFKQIYICDGEEIPSGFNMERVLLSLVEVIGNIYEHPHLLGEKASEG